jgi:beta-aspartyl-peptidase (threonine type)
MTNPRTPWRIAVHGGAGVMPGRDYTEVEAHLADLVGWAGEWLADGASAVDVVEAAVRDLELSGLYVAGRGASPNSTGAIELDAAIMDGAAHRAGAVCAAVDLVSPVRAARAVMDHSPHVLLAGDGAVAFARAHGVEQVADPAGYYRVPVGVDPSEMRPEAGAGLSHGTVGAVALDRAGRLAAATSTSGIFGKLAGRVGDTPLPGAGTWADGHVAVSCTGIGEAFILAGGAGDISARMRYAGAALGDAAVAMLARVAALNGDGGLIAVAADGTIAMPFNTPGMKRAAAGEGMETIVAIL